MPPRFGPGLTSENAKGNDQLAEQAATNARPHSRPLLLTIELRVISECAGLLGRGGQNAISPKLKHATARRLMHGIVMPSSRLDRLRSRVLRTRSRCSSRPLLRAAGALAIQATSPCDERIDDALQSMAQRRPIRIVSGPQEGPPAARRSSDGSRSPGLARRRRLHMTNAHVAARRIGIVPPLTMPTARWTALSGKTARPQIVAP